MTRSDEAINGFFVRMIQDQMRLEDEWFHYQVGELSFVIERSQEIFANGLSLPRVLPILTTVAERN